jgi:hypothetical protein
MEGVRSAMRDQAELMVSVPAVSMMVLLTERVVAADESATMHGSIAQIPA